MNENQKYKGSERSFNFMFYGFSILALIDVLIYGLFTPATADNNEALWFFLMEVLVLSVNLLLYMKLKNRTVATTVFLTLGLIIIFHDLPVSPVPGIVLFHPYILLVFFLSGKWLGASLSAAIILILLSMAMVSETNQGAVVLTFNEVVSFCGTFIPTAVLAFIFRYAKDRSEDGVRKQSEKLDMANKQLLTEIENKKNAESTVIERAEKLENAQKAMVHLMKDLKAEKAKDDALLASIGEGLVVTDRKSNIVLMNQIAGEYLGVPPEEAIGKTSFDSFHLSDLQGHTISLDKRPGFLALAQKEKVVDTYSFPRITGKPISLHITATPVMQGDEATGAIMILRDITKEKEIDRMKTEFISLASHQLRTPLSAIKWFTEMLIGGDAGELSSEQKDFARNISDSTERMIQLVNSLLNISRIESGRIIVDPRPTDLKELVQGIVNDLKAKIEEKQQNLIISVHEDLPKINLDPRLIGQVYMNLLTNAIKYTPKGGEVSVFISKKDDQVISQVADNGYGIPTKDKERIFGKFFRADNVAKVETDGTGLGLYLVKAIIESSQGKVWFESEEGKGTTFWVSLPLSGMQAKEGEVTLDA